MKLKSLLLGSLLVMVPACSNQAQPISIDNFTRVTECGAVVDGIVSNAFLDVAAGSPRYFVGVSLSGANGFVQEAVVTSGFTLDAANRNKPIVTSAVVTYRLSKRVGPTPKPYTVPLNQRFDQGGALVTVLQVISPELGQTLFDGLQPSTAALEDFVDISADVEFRGEFSVSRAPFSTGTLTLPIRAYRSTPVQSCTAGFAPFIQDQASGEVDFCHYVGQSDSLNKMPPLPQVCCGTASAGGC